MKTYRNLYPQITSFENLYWAYRAARKGKRGNLSVAQFERRQEEELFALQDALQEQTYTPGGYHSFYIHEPKRRLISAAPFRDRVVHHALCQVIEPIWERRFISIAMPTGSEKARTAPSTAPRNSPAATPMCCSAMCVSSFPPSTMPSCAASWDA